VKVRIGVDSKEEVRGDRCWIWEV